MNNKFTYDGITYKIIKVHPEVNKVLCKRIDDPKEIIYSFSLDFITMILNKHEKIK